MILLSNGGKRQELFLETRGNNYFLCVVMAFAAILPAIWIVLLSTKSRHPCAPQFCFLHQETRCHLMLVLTTPALRLIICGGWASCVLMSMPCSVLRGRHYENVRCRPTMLFIGMQPTFKHVLPSVSYFDDGCFGRVEHKLRRAITTGSRSQLLLLDNP